MAKANLRRGIFITFEGVEGCGKSTHAKLICRYLKNNALPFLYTKEPGGTKVGEKIRKILLDPENKTMRDITELFLFEANRSQIVDEVIRPALSKKSIVICDRFYDATVAYQGYGGRLNRALIKEMNTLAAGGLRPDLTIVLDIDVKRGLYRAGLRRKKDRMERKEIAYHTRVRRGYRDIARKEPRRVKLIATQDKIDATQNLIRREVLNVIRRYTITR